MANAPAIRTLGLKTRSTAASCCGEEDCCGPEAPSRRATRKIGRNDPCPCNSGYKYKKCCGKGQYLADESKALCLLLFFTSFLFAISYGFIKTIGENSSLADYFGIQTVVNLNQTLMYLDSNPCLSEENLLAASLHCSVAIVDDNSSK